MTTYEKSAYEKLRDERVRQNEERMKQLGLDVSPLKKERNTRTKKKRRTVVPKESAGQKRRSRRLASAADAPNKRSKRLHDDDDLVMLDYRVRDGREKVSRQRDYYEEKNDDGDGDDKATVVYKHVPVRRNRRVAAEKLDLSAKDRKLLGSIDVDHFLAKFREFLEFENKISQPNARNVMRQATKFVHGEGVRYEVCCVSRVAVLDVLNHDLLNANTPLFLPFIFNVAPAGIHFACLIVLSFASAVKNIWLFMASGLFFHEGEVSQTYGRHDRAHERRSGV